MHASDHQGGTEISFHTIHVHLYRVVGNVEDGDDGDNEDDEDDNEDDDEDDDEDDEDDDRLLFLEPKITSDLDANLATISRLPIPAARIRAVKPYLLARFT